MTIQRIPILILYILHMTHTNLKGICAPQKRYVTTIYPYDWLHNVVGGEWWATTVRSLQPQPDKI